MSEENTVKKFRTPEEAERDMNRLYQRFLHMQFPGSLPITWFFFRPLYTEEEMEAMKSFKRESWFKKSVVAGFLANIMCYWYHKGKGGGTYFFRHIGVTLASIGVAYLGTQVDLQDKVVELFPDGVAAWQVLDSRGYINPDTGKLFTPEDMDVFLFGKSFRDEKDPESAIATYIFGLDVRDPKKLPKLETPKDKSDCIVDLNPSKPDDNPGSK